MKSLTPRLPATIAGELPPVPAHFAGPGSTELTLTSRKRLSIKVFSEETQGACSVLEFEALPGACLSAHIHRREDQVLYLISGTLSVVVGEVTRVVGVGEYVFLPRNAVRSWSVVGDVAVCAILVVTPGGLDQMFLELDEFAREIGPESMEDPEVDQERLRIAERYGIEFIQS